MCWETSAETGRRDQAVGMDDRPCKGESHKSIIVYNLISIYNRDMHPAAPLDCFLLQATLSSLSASLSITNIRFRTANTARSALVHDSSASVLLGLAADPPLTLPTSPRADMPMLAESLIECLAILSFWILV